MAPKKFVPVLVVLAIVFVTTADSYAFLPDPVRNASYKSRVFIIGLWPDWLKPKNQNEQREQEIEQLGK
ncbi:MAG: hypothetical protein ACFB9N_04330 [Geitlerinemataceae cyanobacterium]